MPLDVLIFVGKDRHKAVREARACLLYADRVVLDESTQRPGPLDPDAHPPCVEAQYSALLAAEQVGAVERWRATPWPRREGGEPFWMEGHNKFIGQWFEGVTERLKSAVPVVDEATAIFVHSNQAAVDVAEVSLATHLLGQLPAFPDASTDVLLDIRARLAQPRVRFRQAMAESARELADVPAADFSRAVAAHRRRHVDGALLDIREALENLRPWSSLKRLARSSFTDRHAAPTAASLVIGAAFLDPITIISAGTSSVGVIAGAKELSARGEIRDEIQRKPYWYLHEVEQRLTNS